MPEEQYQMSNTRRTMPEGIVTLLRVARGKVSFEYPGVLQVYYCRGRYKPESRGSPEKNSAVSPQTFAAAIDEYAALICANFNV